MHFTELMELISTKTGKRPQKSGSGYAACCPAHDDENPSLAVSEDQNGTILLHCFAGCNIDDICRSLGLQVSDLFISPQLKSESNKTIYSYKDEEGTELYRKIRIEPGVNGKIKSFYWERVGENGEVIKSIKGCRKVLYHLPEVLQAILEKKTLYLVEGEKDVDRLLRDNLIATTSPESVTWPDEFTNVLKEADIILLYDLDKAGIERKNLLCQNLHGKVRRLRVLDLPGLEFQESHGEDITDWLAKGHTISELLDIASKIPDYSIPIAKGKIRAVNLGEFLDMKLPEREMLLSPFLPSQGLAMIYAKRGVGKTHVALGIAGAIARGGKFLKWQAPKAKKVLFIDGEMPGSALQERLQRMAANDVFDSTSRGNLRLITPDLQEGPMPDLSTKAGRASIEEYVIDSDLIIIDNISSLFRSGIENEAESWQPAQDWALELRRRGKSVLFIHHAGKGGQQRGSSKKEDILDTVICLKHPANYRSDQGAKFEVVFEKTRHFTGDNAAPFQVELRETEDGLWNWHIEEVPIDPEVVRVAELSKQGYTINQIMDETGLSKSKVEGRLKKAREQQLID